MVDVFQAGAGVSFHMNSNEVIANRAVEILGGKLGDYSIVHPNDHVNYGQSTNDVFPTGMRLATLLELEKLCPVLDSLVSALEKKGKEFHDILKSGRTHMQDAVPMRLGQELRPMRGPSAAQKMRFVQPLNHYASLGLGGSAVGPAIDTHPGLSRGEPLPSLAQISKQKLIPVDDMRYAMQSNFAMASVFRAAEPCLGSDPHFERPAPALLPGQIPASLRSTCLPYSRVLRSCQEKSIRSCRN